MDFIELVKLIGIPGAVIALSLFLYSKFYMERKLDEYRKEDQKEIEKLKGKLDQNKAIVSDLIKNYSIGSEISQNKKIEGVEKFWETIMELREFNSTVHFILTILTKKEVEEIYLVESEGNNNMRKYLKTLYINTPGEISKKTSKIEYYRPFAGEELWVYFVAYRTFLLRVHYLLIKERNNNKILHWLDDTNSKRTLSEILDKKEIDFIYKDEFHAYDKAVTILENKILNIMQQIISGDIEINNSLEKVKQIMRLMSDNKYK